MIIKLVKLHDIEEKEKWVADYFTTALIPQHKSSEDYVPLSELVKERRESIEPQLYKDIVFNYLSLENVESLSGALVNFTPRKGTEIKSRSKIFRRGDVLFGKLRPNLNKVYLVDEDIDEGICTTEFLVLIPNPKKLLPLYLRTILSTKYIQDQMKGLTSGAALPRIQTSDLLGLSIPCPPLETQRKLEAFIEKQLREWQAIRLKAEILPRLVTQETYESIEQDRRPSEAHLRIERKPHQWKNPLPMLQNSFFD